MKGDKAQDEQKHYLTHSIRSSTTLEDNDMSVQGLL